jgi:hypothetical protein
VRLALSGLLRGHAVCYAGIWQSLALYKAGAVPQLSGARQPHSALEIASTPLTVSASSIVVSVMASAVAAAYLRIGVTSLMGLRSHGP